MKIYQGNKQDEANKIYSTSILSLKFGNYFNNILAFLKHLPGYNSKPGLKETLKIRKGSSSIRVTCLLFVKCRVYY